MSSELCVSFEVKILHFGANPPGAIFGDKFWVLAPLHHVKDKVIGKIIDAHLLFRIPRQSASLTHSVTSGVI